MLALPLPIGYLGASRRDPRPLRGRSTAGARAGSRQKSILFRPSRRGGRPRRYVKLNFKLNVVLKHVRCIQDLKANQRVLPVDVRMHTRRDRFGGGRGRARRPEPEIKQISRWIVFYVQNLSGETPAACDFVDLAQ